MTRNRIFTDGLLSYIKRPGGAGGALNGNQLIVGGAARCTGGVANPGSVQAAVIGDKISQGIGSARGKGGHRLQALPHRPGGAGGASGALKSLGTGRTGGTRDAVGARDALGPGGTGRAVYLCTTLDFPLC